TADSRKPARNLTSDESKCSAKPVPNQSVRKVLRMLANEGKYKEVLPALATHQSTNKSTGNQLRSSTLCNSRRSLGCTTVVMLSPHEPRDARTTLAFHSFRMLRSSVSQGALPPESDRTSGPTLLLIEPPRQTVPARQRLQPFR